MIVSIASGKGGTGKTTVAVNLAKVLGGRAQYLDCDVEEPNGHIFLKPEIAERRDVSVPIPTFDYGMCDYCGRCQEVCQFNALLVLRRKKVVFFPELCHACGACTLFCPRGAISEQDRRIGTVESGYSGEVGFVHGMLNVGEPLAPPVIREVLKQIDDERLAIVDSAPGTSCSAVEAVRDSDYCVLVTEPTPFGLNDLELAVEMLKVLDIPYGVVVNRSDIGDDRVEGFCRERGATLLLSIPHDMRVARAYSRGELIVDALPEYRAAFEKLASGIETEVERVRVAK